MGKVKVKKIQNKEEKKNPFDLRFNKVKHKVVNQKLTKSEYGSNPYQSRNRANEIRKKSLLVDYQNRNKSGFVKFVDKSKFKKEDNNNHQIKTTNNQIKKKKKDNSEYMMEMFEKKRQSQLERDKVEDLKMKLDDQWKQVKNSFLSKELARKESNETKKIDEYDLIFNDLLINPGQRLTITK